jgi:hypothetical protein
VLLYLVKSRDDSGARPLGAQRNLPYRGEGSFQGTDEKAGLINLTKVGTSGASLSTTRRLPLAVIVTQPLYARPSDPLRLTKRIVSPPAERIIDF